MPQRYSTITPKVSTKIANMAIICAFLVLFIHLPGSVDTNIIKKYFSWGLGSIAVPFFFVVSGYLLAGHFDDSGWWRSAILKRVRTLYIPMFIWCVLYFAFNRFLFPMAMNLCAGRSLSANLDFYVSVSTIARIFALHPFAEPYLGVLWFIKTLLVFVIMSPLLKHMANPICIMIIFSLQLLLGPSLGGTPPPLKFTLLKGYLPICGAAFFCVGMFLRMRDVYLELSHTKALLLLSIGLGLMFVREVGLIQLPLIINRLLFCYVPILLLAVWALCPQKPLPDIFVKASFAVYVLHMFVIRVIEILLSHFSVVQNELMCYIVLGVVSFLICVVLSWLMRKILSKNMQDILFGGR